MPPQQAWRQPHSSAPVYSYPHMSAPNLRVPPAPPPPKRPKRNHGVLVGALVFITTLIVVAGVIAVVEFTSTRRPLRYVTVRRDAEWG